LIFQDYFVMSSMIFEGSMFAGLKIILDLRCIRSGMTGIGISALQMVSALAKSRCGHQLTGLFLKGCVPEEIRQSGIEILEVSVDHEHHPMGEFWLNFSLPRLLSSRGADVFHGTAFLIPWVKTPFRKIVTIHDLIAYKFPETYPWGFRKYIKLVTRFSAHHADRIIVPSENTGHDLQAILGVSADKIDVVPHYAPSAFRALNGGEKEVQRTALALPDKFILNVGTLEPRKNQIALIEAFEIIRRKTSLPHHLILAGREGYRAGEILDKINRSPCAKYIHYFPELDDERLSMFYALADVFVFPSRYDGFGLPVLEAMASGTPVIVAETSSLPEVVGDAGIFIPPDSTGEIAKRIISLLSDKKRLSEFRERGIARAALFTPERTASLILSSYEKVAR